MQNERSLYQNSIDYLSNRLPLIPESCIILGSGLGKITDKLINKIEIPYNKIPGFALSTVDSHAGKLVYGELSGKSVLCMSGRFHYYEGYSMESLVYPVRVFAGLGIKNLIVTNAAGGVNESFKIGDLMLITDHIKLVAPTPVRGTDSISFGKRFFDMTAYTPRLKEIALSCAMDLGIDLKEGVYFYMPGPQFETPAEIRAIRILGGDAVGMSTVPEVIAARQLEMNILGISLISNMAAGIDDCEISDDDVVLVGNQSSEKFSSLISNILLNL